MNIVHPTHVQKYLMNKTYKLEQRKNLNISSKFRHKLK